MFLLLVSLQGALLLSLTRSQLKRPLGRRGLRYRLLRMLGGSVEVPGHGFAFLA